MSSPDPTVKGILDDNYRRQIPPVLIVPSMLKAVHWRRRGRAAAHTASRNIAPTRSLGGKDKKVGESTKSNHTAT